MFLTILSFYFPFEYFENWKYYAVVEAIIEGGALALYIVMEVMK